MKHYILYVLGCLLALAASLPLSAQELRAMPPDIIMPQKLTLKQPHSGKGSFTVKEEGQVAYGFALPGETVTLELKPNTKDGYSVDNSLIKVYETNDPTTTAIKLSGSGNTYTFPMPNAPVTIEVEFMKELTIIPDEGQVVYAGEKIEEYHPTYKVEGITEADGNVVFTGNLKVGGDNKIVNDKLSAGDAYKIEVTPDVTVAKLEGKYAKDAEATLSSESQINGDGWFILSPVKMLPPRGFLIKKTPAPAPAPASLSLRDAADAEEYVAELFFTEEGEHTINYTLKRIGMDKEYSKSIIYKLDTQVPTYNVSVSNRTATVKLTDQASGLSTCSYIWDGGAEQSVTGFKPGDKEATFTLTGKVGTHTLKLTAIDQAGNKLTEDNIQVELKDHYVPPINPDNGGDDNNGGGNGGGGDDDNDPDEPVANEVISANHSGIYVENGKLCLEASQPCRVSIYNYQGGTVMTRRIPSGKTRLYDLPAGQYIVRLSAPHLPQGKVVRKVRVR